VRKLVFGEDNSNSGGDFPIVCQKDATGKEGIAPSARWMWYSPDGSNRFRYMGSGNTTRRFLVFRLSATVVPVMHPKQARADVTA
jgi:hypothetical protein